MDSRLKKQIIIAIVFFAFVGLSGFGTFRYLVPPTPTPTPDPTANLTPLAVRSSYLLPIEGTDYDFVAEIENKNPNYGATRFAYAISFMNTDGVEVDKKIGSSFILPSQIKYIVESPLRFSQQIASVRMTISEVEWRQPDSFLFDTIQIALVGDPAFERRDIPGVFGLVAGSLRNNSEVTLNDIDIAVILEDSSGKPIGVAKTSLNTSLAQTTRGFETRWYSPLPSEPARVRVGIYTNLFELANIMRTRRNGI